MTSTEHHTKPEVRSGVGGHQLRHRPDNGDAPGTGVLADTGAPPFLDWFAVAGTVLLVGGLALVLGSRRRRS